MRLVIIAVIALLVLGGGGAGAYYYFNNQANASANAEAGKAEKEAKKAEHEKSKDVEYVRLDPLILPVIDKDGMTQVVSLVVAIEVANKHDTELVQRLVPRLTDAFIQDMYGVLGKNAMKDGVIQIDYIKKRLNSITNKVLGQDIANDVLLQVVQQRPA
jgi:flagellar protein FliL